MQKLLFISISICVTLPAVAQNIGINTTGATPNTYAILDLNTGSTFTNPNGKGLLIPNVSLASTTDITIFGSVTPPTSLLVYNTNVLMTSGWPGYWYWDGAKWVPFVTNSVSSGGGWLLTGNTGTTASTSSIGTTVNNNFIGTTDATDFVFVTNNLERMRVTSAGNLGIGIISPTTQLHIVGSANTEFRLEDYSGGTLLRMYGANGSYSSPTANTSGQVLGGLACFGYNGSAFVRGGRIYIGTIEPWTSSTNGSYIAFETAPSGSASTASKERMRIDNVGNVGIGTTTPNAAAMVDMATGSPGNEGFLGAQVALTNVTTWSPLTGSATNGMLVYNTSTTTIGGYGVGYYYWANNQWNFFLNAGSTHGQQTFTSSGTFTTGAGVTVVWVTMCGGGGGGYCNVCSGGFSGGNGGTAMSYPLSVTGSTAYTITVGVGGTANFSTTGNTGGSSSFGALLTVGGGAGAGSTFNGANGSGYFVGQILGSYGIGSSTGGTGANGIVYVSW